MNFLKNLLFLLLLLGGVFSWSYVFFDGGRIDYFSGIKKLHLDVKEDRITFTFAGDMMFGRFVGNKYQENNFEDLIGDTFFKDVDIAWANLEGPVSRDEVSQSTNPNDVNFLFSRETINALNLLNLNSVGLSNNHTLNNGPEGFLTTTDLLERSGIAWHGHPINISSDSVLRFQEGDLKVSLIALHTLYGLKENEAKELIKSESDSFVIVLPHWGVEYITKHSTNQERLARDWIEAGADLIIGMHPHVVQDAQVIDGKLIIYSLGNFIFDQIAEETKTGLLVSGYLERDLLEIRLFALKSQLMKPSFADEDVQEKIVKRVCENIKEYCDIDDVIRIPL